LANVRWRSASSGRSSTAAWNSGIAAAVSPAAASVSASFQASFSGCAAGLAPSAAAAAAAAAAASACCSAWTSASGANVNAIDAEPSGRIVTAGSAAPGLSLVVYGSPTRARLTVRVSTCMETGDQPGETISIFHWSSGPGLNIPTTPNLPFLLVLPSYHVSVPIGWNRTTMSASGCPFRSTAVPWASDVAGAASALAPAVAASSNEHPSLRSPMIAPGASAPADSAVAAPIIGLGFRAQQPRGGSVRQVAGLSCVPDRRRGGRRVEHPPRTARA
jgi:hypothetical protein